MKVWIPVFCSLIALAGVIAPLLIANGRQGDRNVAEAQRVGDSIRIAYLTERLAAADRGRVVSERHWVRHGTTEPAPTTERPTPMPTDTAKIHVLAQADSAAASESVAVQPAPLRALFGGKAMVRKLPGLVPGKTKP